MKWKREQHQSGGPDPGHKGIKRKQADEVERLKAGTGHSQECSQGAMRRECRTASKEE